ncbi:MAG: hypothetical protein CVU84_16940 [Firmicutes bacterium HGW-Firmicutes-1]|jgi:uncharacterized protein YegP (UPF0339 family)|nr:MAG: hypothetical protein CVU84_16940 [Firmicutes bacterium HGW-Firmicutes-1]
MLRGAFEIKRNAVGQFYFVFKDPNNATVAVSQSFLERSYLEVCVSKIRDEAKFASINDLQHPHHLNPLFDISCNESGEYIFMMISITGEIIMYSEGFDQKELCIEKLEIFKRYAQDARIVDLT